MSWFNGGDVAELQLLHDKHNYCLSGNALMGFTAYDVKKKAFKGSFETVQLQLLLVQSVFHAMCLCTVWAASWSLFVHKKCRDFKILGSFSCPKHVHDNGTKKVDMPVIPCLWFRWHLNTDLGSCGTLYHIGSIEGLITENSLLNQTIELANYCTHT